MRLCVARSKVTVSTKQFTPKYRDWNDTHIHIMLGLQIVTKLNDLLFSLFDKMPIFNVYDVTTYKILLCKRCMMEMR